MQKRPFCGMAAGLILGILIAVSGRTWLLPVSAAVLILGVPLMCGIQGEKSVPGIRRRIIFRTFLVILMLFMGANRQKEEERFREGYLPWLADGMPLLVQGRLDQKELKNEQYIYYLTSCVIGRQSNQNTVPVPCNRIMVYSDSDDYSIGEILVLNGTIELWKNAVNEGNFDAASYYRALKTDFKLKDGEVLAVYGKEARFREWLYQLRMRLREVYASAMGPEDRGVLSTMVLGDKSLLDAEIKQLYQTAGISHILAISGLHISVIGMSLYRLLRKTGFGFGCAGILAGSCMVCYGNMVGMGTSVRRAVGMFLLLLAAEAAGRSYDSLNALAFLAVLLLLENPGLLFYAGFLFSFAAVLGAVWIGGAMMGRGGETEGGLKGDGKGKDGRKKSPLQETLKVSIAIQLATLPLAAWYYYEIPVYSVVINLAVLPLMGAVLFLGIAGGAAGLWSIGTAKVLLFPCHLILSGYYWLCERLANVPSATWVTGRPQFVKLIFYYVILAGITGIYHACKTKVQNTGRNYIIPAGIVLLFLLLIRPKEKFEIDVLDVGQGDGSFLRTEEGFTVFVDGGSSDIKRVGEYRILPFLKYKGAAAIDYWVVSHTDADHISGLTEVLESGYTICNLVFAEEIVRDEIFEKLLDLSEEKGTEAIYLKSGDTLHLGGAEFFVISPDLEMEGTDKNAKSLVLRYEEAGFSALFTGDIGVREEKRILGLQKVEPVTFYKAAHHGSKYSNSDDFLNYLRPDISVISCGMDNRYGHPGEAAVEHMEQAGSTVFYTMEGGQIKITREGDEAVVWKYRKPLEEYRISVVE